MTIERIKSDEPSKYQNVFGASNTQSITDNQQRQVAEFARTYTEDPTENLFYTNDFSNFENIIKKTNKDKKNIT